MKFNYFLMIILFISIGHISKAEKHNASPELAEEFATAVKNVETKNFIDAVKIFEKLAQKGLPEAQFNLSLLYSSGLGTPKNYKTALYWSWQAHLNDHPTAINQVNEIFDLVTIITFLRTFGTIHTNCCWCKSILCREHR